MFKPFRKYAVGFVVAAVLHQPAVSLLVVFKPGTMSAVVRVAIDSPAWAEENPGAPDAAASTVNAPPVQQTDVQTSPTSSVRQELQPEALPQVEEKRPLLPEESAKPEEFRPKTGFVDLVQSKVSRGLFATAEWLDSFFGNERVLKEKNRSYLRVRYDVFREASTPATYNQPSFDLRLALPMLERKTHLVFSAEPAEPANVPPGAPVPESTTGASIPKIAQPRTPEERNLTAALHYLVRATPSESYIIRSGALLSHGSPVLFIGPRYRSLVPFASWDFRFTEEVIYRTDTAWQSGTSLDLERPLPHELFFRTDLSGLWLSNTSGYFYSLGFSLSQPFDATHAVNYSWTNSFQTSPVHELTEVLLSVEYRHSLWRKWFFFEVIPQCRFPRDRNFDATPGILFRFETFFGWSG